LTGIFQIRYVFSRSVKKYGENVILVHSHAMTSKVFGQLIRARRKKLGMNQADLALVSGTGLRFISDLENGKDSCQMGLAFRVLASLGLITTIEPKER